MGANVKITFVKCGKSWGTHCNLIILIQYGESLHPTLFSCLEKNSVSKILLSHGSFVNFKAVSLKLRQDFLCFKLDLGVLVDAHSSPIIGVISGGTLRIKLGINCWRVHLGAIGSLEHVIGLPSLHILMPAGTYFCIWCFDQFKLILINLERIVNVPIFHQIMRCIRLDLAVCSFSRL